MRLNKYLSYLKKISFKRLLILSVLTYIMGSLLIAKFDHRPVKFENYKTSEALQVFLDKKYHVGSDGMIAFKDLELSKAKCNVVSEDDQIPNDLRKYDFIGWCEYTTGWLAWPPKEHYQAIILGDKYKQIIEIFVTKNSGFDL